MPKILKRKCCMCGQLAIWKDNRRRVLGRYYCEHCFPRKNDIKDFYYCKSGFTLQNKERFFYTEDIIETYHKFAPLFLGEYENNIISEYLYEKVCTNASIRGIHYNKFMSKFAEFVNELMIDIAPRRKLINKFLVKFKTDLKKKAILK